MNVAEVKYYQFMISVNKYTENYSVLSPKICVPKETKDITNKDEAKTRAEYLSCVCKCKLSSTTGNSN